MPRRAAGGVKERSLRSPPSIIDDKPFKPETPTSSTSTDSIADISIGEATYSLRGLPRFEEYCMCVAGLLPQHIRNLIMSKDIEAIAALLDRYQDALNSASTEDAVSLYTQDGVYMPQHASSFVGIDNLRKAYDGLFSTTKHNVKFDIQEIVPVAPDWAFARTLSVGTTDVKGRGLGNEANQELFIFQKAGGEWKIARICFSTTNPPPK